MDASSSRHAFNMKVLSRYDPHAVSLLQSTSFVVLYSYTQQNAVWSKTSIEGPLFIYARSTAPTYGFFILNRNGVDNFIATLGEEDELDCNEGFVVYRPASEGHGNGDEEEEGEGDAEECTYGIWIFEEEQRDALGKQMLRLHQHSSSSDAAADPAAPASAPASSSTRVAVDALFASSSSTSSTGQQPRDVSGPALLDQMFASAQAGSSAAPEAATPRGQGSTSLLDMLFASSTASSNAARNTSHAPAPAPAPAPAHTSNPTASRAHMQAPPADALPLPSPTSARRDSGASARQASTEPLAGQASTSAEGLMALLGLGQPASASEPASKNGTRGDAQPAPAAQQIGVDDLFGQAVRTSAPAKEDGALAGQSDERVVRAAQEELRAGRCCSLRFVAREEGIIAGRGVLLDMEGDQLRRELLQRSAQKRGVQLREGDVVIARGPVPEQDDAKSASLREAKLSVIFADGESLATLASTAELLERWTFFVSGISRRQDGQ